MEDELRRGASHAFAVRHVVERLLQFGMLGDVLANLVHALAR